MTAFYAYIHAKPDGTPFYVGKGTIHRARMVKRKNAGHEAVVAHYGADNILVGALHCSTEALAFELECGLIKCLRRMKINLVNKTAGGEGSSGYIPSDETKKKQATANRGIKRSSEFKEKMRAIGKLRGVSEVTRAAQLLAVTGRQQTPEEKEKRAAKIRGRRHTPEARAKMSAANKADWQKRKAKKAEDGLA